MEPQDAFDNIIKNGINYIKRPSGNFRWHRGYLLLQIGFKRERSDVSTFCFKCQPPRVIQPSSSVCMNLKTLFATTEARLALWPHLAFPRAESLPRVNRILLKHYPLSNCYYGKVTWSQCELLRGRRKNSHHPAVNLTVGKNGKKTCI